MWIMRHPDAWLWLIRCSRNTNTNTHAHINMTRNMLYMMTHAMLIKKAHLRISSTGGRLTAVYNKGGEHFWPGQIFFLILLKYSLYLLEKQQKILACIREDNLYTTFLYLPIAKVFTPWLLTHCFSWSIRKCLNPFIIVVFESICKRCRKIKNLQDFPEEPQQINCSEQTRNSNNHQ